MMKPPFLNNEGVFDAVFPLVDSSTERTPRSKSALTPLQKERQHVASVLLASGVLLRLLTPVAGGDEASS